MENLDMLLDSLQYKKATTSKFFDYNLCNELRLIIKNIDYCTPKDLVDLSYICGVRDNG